MIHSSGVDRGSVQHSVVDTYILPSTVHSSSSDRGSVQHSMVDTYIYSVT